MKVESCDVLVVGSGGAGLRAAIELFDNKVDVVVLGKCEMREAHTKWATGGINAALGTLDPKDNWMMHAADTIQDGGFLNDPIGVSLLCKNAPHTIKELSKWGTKFHKEKNGKITQRFFGAARFRRACFIGDRTGLAILNTLVDQALKRKLRFHSSVYIFSLLTNNGKVNGAIGLDMKKGKLRVFHAKSVILATGGHSRMFRRCSSRFWENNGDGIRLAYNAGASFMDMELFQFHPTGMVFPDKAEGLLATESIRGEGGILTNAKGERFMKKYDPKRMELSARDIVAESIHKEVLEGRGTRHGGVWLDITHRPKSYILDRLPYMYWQFKEYAKIDITKQKMEIAPTAHYSMGGIHIDHKTGKTGVPNLYAIGECTSGMHGGNRLGGNSLAEICVFGRLTGKNVAKDIKKKKFVPLDEKLVQKESKKFMNSMSTKGKNPTKVKKDIQQVMWESAGLIRNQKGLEKGLKRLQKFHKVKLATGKSLKMNQRLIDALDVMNMLPTCEMILKSAMFRKESRRAHVRSDYPKTLPKWQKNILCVPTKSGFKIVTKKVPPMPKQIRKYITKEEIKTYLLE